MKVKVYGADAKALTEGDIFRVHMTSVEGRTVAVLEKQDE